MVAGRDRRPGDVFEYDDEAKAADLVKRGACDAIVVAVPVASADASADAKRKRKA